MKTSILYLAFTFAVGLAGGAQSFSTTFAEYDQMTFEEQSKFIADRSVKIYSWLKDNEPGKAKCMYEKFKIGQNAESPPEPLIKLESKIKGVPTEDRPKYHVESLMANYIVDNLCANSTVQTVSSKQPKQTVK